MIIPLVQVGAWHNEYVCKVAGSTLFFSDVIREILMERHPKPSGRPAGSSQWTWKSLKHQLPCETFGDHLTDPKALTTCSLYVRIYCVFVYIQIPIFYLCFFILKFEKHFVYIEINIHKHPNTRNSFIKVGFFFDKIYISQSAGLAKFISPLMPSQVVWSSCEVPF